MALRSRERVCGAAAPVLAPAGRRDAGEREWLVGRRTNQRAVGPERGAIVLHGTEQRAVACCFARAERCVQLQAASQGRANARPVLLLKEIKGDGYLEHRAWQLQQLVLPQAFRA